jgi:predicted MPP superfamily phosphohydrolase
MREFKFLTFIIIGTLMIGTITVVGINQSNKEVIQNSFDDFYFVQLTDTHIRHKIIDFFEKTTNNLKTVVEKVISYENPPAFIVITGDLCEWAGSDPIGALNAQAFTSCFYEENDQLYADQELSIPIYTTPGNHDYVITRDLNSYHTYIDKKHVEDEDRYIITYGDVSLFFMDTGPNYYSNPLIMFKWHGEGLFDDDIDWLDQELSNCVSNYKIVLMHHPAVGSEQDLFIRNRKAFVDLCEAYNVDVVLAGHTHNDQIYYYEDEAVKVEDRPLNSSQFSTLYVQSDDCKQVIHYRNISIKGNDIWIESNEELKPSNYEEAQVLIYENIYLKIFERVFFNRSKYRHI